MKKDSMALMRLLHKLRTEKERPAVRKLLNWPDLYGLGKGLWGKTDAKDFVSSLRENRG
jgi:hypothetical protein